MCWRIFNHFRSTVHGRPKMPYFYRVIGSSRQVSTCGLISSFSNFLFLSALFFVHKMSSILSALFFVHEMSLLILSALFFVHKMPSIFWPFFCAQRVINRPACWTFLRVLIINWTPIFEKSLKSHSKRNWTMFKKQKLVF